MSDVLDCRLSNINYHSYIRISEAICQILQSNPPIEGNVEQHDAVGALEKSFAFIKQKLLTMKKDDAKKTKAIVGFVQQTFY